MIAPAPRRLLAAPLLARAEERELFLKMNEHRTAATWMQRQTEPSPTLAERRAAERRLAAARAIRNRIAEANLRLVVAVAKKFANSGQSLEDLVSEGTLPLLRAVELFDVSKGNAFSTYATHALRHHYYRVLKRQARRLGIERTAPQGVLADIPEERSVVADPSNVLARVRQAAAELIQELPDRERTIIAARYGLEGHRAGHSFSEIGRSLCLSKERVRVLAHRALEKLRDEAERRGLELPECA